MRFSLILLGICGVLAAPAAAQVQVPQRLEGDYHSAAYALAQAVHVVQLVRSKRVITLDREPFGERPSDLRVSLVVLDAGSSTDLAPRYDLHIAMFNDVIEHGIAWANEPVESVFGFEKVERTAPGIYEAHVTTLNPKWLEDECSFLRTRITIDARQLSAVVRRASGLHEFDVQRYTRPIDVTREMLGCVEP